MDEPLGALDAEFREMMCAELKKLHTDIHATTIYVTHDQTEAMAMGDRIVVMSDAVVQQVGTPAEVYYDPANLFVAGFIGTPPMNLLSGQVEAGGGSVQVAGVRLAVAPSTGAGLAARAGQPVTVGVRPEKVSDDVTVGGGTALEVRVEIVEPLGPEVILHGRVGDEAIVAKLDPHRSPEPGTTVTLVLDPDATHLFDPPTGRRID